MQLIIPGNKPLVGFDLTKQVLDPEFGWAAGGADARATTRTVLRGGTLYTVAANTPAYGDNGLSIEPAATNLLLYSEQFDNAYWTNLVGRLTITANAGVAPDGTTTAELITGTASGSNYYGITKNGGVAVFVGTAYTHSRYVKYVDQRWVYMDVDGGATAVWFDLLNGVVGTESSGCTGRVESVGNGWYRISLTYTAADTAFGEIGLWFCDADGSALYSGGTNSLYMWGAQLEASPVPTAYIPTVASTVSRAADAVSWSLPQALKDILSVEEPTPTSAYDETSGAVVLSTVDGAAFVMPDDGSGADLSPYAGTHVIKVVDSAGKVAWGYLGSAGTGETLGSEIVAAEDDRTFTSDTGWWTKSTGVDINSTTAGKAHFEAVSAGGSLARSGVIAANNLYRIAATISGLTSGGYRAYAGGSGLSAGPIHTSNGSYVDYVTQGGSYYTLYLTSFVDGSTFDLDDVSVRAVTAPPATGCWVVSTPGGSTKNWAYIESGFAPNSIASYDLYPISQWRAEGTLVVKGWVPGFNYSDLPNGNYNIIAAKDYIYNLLYCDDAGKFKTSTDGILGTFVDADFTKSTSYDLAVRWSSITGLFQVGYKLSTASTWTWGSTAAFDGAFTLGSSLNIGYSPDYPFEIGKMQFYDRWMDEGSL